MITPEQMKSKKFTNVGKGVYRSSEVEDFLVEIIDDYERLFAAHKEDSEKLMTLAEAVENYRREADIIQRTMVNAQRVADETVSAAKQQAQDIIDQATGRASTEAEALKNNADAYFKKVTTEANSLKRRTEQEHEAMIKSVLQKSQSITDEANERAEKLIIDTKEAAVSAIERANAQLEAVRQECKRLTAQARSQLSTISKMSNRFRTDMAALLSQQTALLGNEQAQQLDLDIADVGDESFEPLTREETDATEFTPAVFDPDKDFENIIIEDDKPEPQADTVVPEPVAAQPEAEKTVDTVQPEARRTRAGYTPKFGDFEDISSNADEASEPSAGRAMTYEQAKAQLDLLDMLERGEELPERYAADSAEPGDEDGEYAQPSLFDNAGRAESFRRDFLAEVDDDDYDEYNEYDDAADDAPDDNGGKVPVTFRGKPLAFGENYDMQTDEPSNGDSGRQKRGGKRKK